IELHLSRQRRADGRAAQRADGRQLHHAAAAGGPRRGTERLAERDGDAEVALRQRRLRLDLDDLRIAVVRGGEARAERGGELVIGQVLQIGRDLAAIERIALEREALPWRRGRRIEGDDLALVGQHLLRYEGEGELRRGADVEQFEVAAVELIVADGAAEGEFQLRVRRDLRRSVRGEDGDEARRRRVERDVGHGQNAVAVVEDDA